VSQLEMAKKTLKQLFLEGERGSVSFKVIDVNIFIKLVTNACYHDK